MTILIGYARVSTTDQNLDAQIDALKQVGCQKIYTDKASGAHTERKGLIEALDYLRAGDVLVVTKLDRLGRSIKQLIELVTLLDEKKIGFKSLTENIDTTTSGGKLIFHIFSALAEFERDIIRERTRAGLKAARKRGRTGGRPREITEKKIEQIKALYESNKSTVTDICKSFSISRSTFYKRIKVNT
jgi:DNA invertase Pin-like site-specific DNA recombinase